MFRSCPVLAVAALFGAGLAPTARADELPVPSARFPSVQRALRAARSGDVIRLAPGEYRLKRLTLRRKGVTLEGDGVTIRLRSERRRVKLRGEDCVVRGVRFEGAAVLLRGDGARLEDCRLDGEFRIDPIRMKGTNNRLLGSDLTHVRLAGSADRLVAIRGKEAVVADNRLHVNSDAARSSGRAIHVEAELAIITRNTITSRIGADDYGIVIGSDRTVVSDNLFRAIGGPAIGIWASAVRIERNRFEELGLETLIRLIGDTVDVSGNVIVAQRRRLGLLISSNGDGLTVADNTVTGVDGPGFRCHGDDVHFERNSVTGAGRGLHAGIEVIGDDAVILDNHVERLGGSTGGIVVRGDRATIRRNTVSNPDTYDEAGNGIDHRGDAAEIADNETEWVATGLRVVGDENTVSGHVARRTRTDGIRIEGDENGVADCQALSIRWDGISVRGDGNAVIRCGVSGALESGPAGPSRGFFLNGEGNRLADCTADDLRRDGVSVAGQDNVVERVTVAAPGDGFWIVGDRNVVRHCEITSFGGIGFRIVRGEGHVLLRCTSRGGAPGIELSSETQGALIDVCSTIDAAGDGLVNHGASSTILDSTFLGSGGTDVVSSAPPLLQSGNTFATGGFPEN